MRREDILDSLEYIDDEYIEEADRSRSEGKTAGGPNEAGTSEKTVPVRKKAASVRRWGALAASFAVLIVAAFILTGILRMRSANMESMKSAEIAVEENSPAEEPEPAETAETPAVIEDMESTEAEKADAEESPNISAMQETAGAAEPSVTAEQPETAEMKKEKAADEEVRIQVSSGAGEVVFVLNDTPAAKSLLSQLPLTVDTEPYSDNEIVFQPDLPLDTENSMENGGTAGYLGYFAPWNHVVMYYGDFETYPGLYILGEAISGAEHIQDIKGRITVSVY